MQFAVLFAGLTVFLIIVGLMYKVGKKIDQQNRRIKAVKSTSVGQDIVDEELKLPLSDRLIKPIKMSFINAMRKLSIKNRDEIKQKDTRVSKSRDKTLKALQVADIDINYEAFNLIKIGAAVTLGLVVFLIVFLGFGQLQYGILAALVGLGLGYMAPTFIVGKKGKARNASILHDLPSVMDLLVVSVEAGLGLDASIARLYERNKSPLLKEMMKTVRDVQMGLSRRESLKAMGERCEVKEVQAFASSLIQAEQLGVSIKKVLRTQADQLRQSYRQRCETKAMKAPVKMMVPMVIFILPVLFIILLGPAVPQIMEVF